MAEVEAQPPAEPIAAGISAGAVSPRVDRRLRLPQFARLLLANPKSAFGIALFAAIVSLRVRQRMTDFSSRQVERDSTRPAMRSLLKRSLSRKPSIRSSSGRRSRAVSR